jgi:hypothetical protein
LHELTSKFVGFRPEPSRNKTDPGIGKQFDYQSNRESNKHESRRQSSEQMRRRTLCTPLLVQRNEDGRHDVTLQRRNRQQCTGQTGSEGVGHQGCAEQSREGNLSDKAKKFPCESASDQQAGQANVAPRADAIRSRDHRFDKCRGIAGG